MYVFMLKNNADQAECIYQSNENCTSLSASQLSLTLSTVSVSCCLPYFGEFDLFNFFVIYAFYYNFIFTAETRALHCIVVG